MTQKTEFDDRTTVEVMHSDGTKSGPMPLGTFAAAAELVAPGPPDFALEPSEHGTVPERIISELRSGRARAKDATQAYSDACKAQAERYGIKPAALKRYIAALEDDKVDEAAAEAADLERLIDGPAP